MPWSRHSSAPSNCRLGRGETADSYSKYAVCEAARKMTEIIAVQYAALAFGTER